MTAFRLFVGSKRGWASCALVGVLLTLGGLRLAAQPATESTGGVFLEPPTLVIPLAQKVRPAAAQLPPPKAKLPAADGAGEILRLEVPGPEVMFRLESEEDMRERIRQERKGLLVEFPDSRIVLSKERSFGRQDWSPMGEVVEPYYTVYRRLYFEQINAERYGWDFGYLHPLIATGTFFFDTLTLPLQIIAEPCRHYEYNSGLCLPGEPVPLLLYPPHPK